MKFDDQLAAYLYEYKSLKLEGIGTFTLDEKLRVPSQQEKEVYYPIEGLAFSYDPKSETDEKIIFFLVKNLHKIEPLVRSDLEFYLSNIRVLLNIGNPYTIEGIGTLNKNNHGIFEFTPGNFLPAKQDLHPRRENPAHNYPVRSRFSAGRVLVIILVAVAALSALGGIGWAILNFTSKQSISSDNGSPETSLITANTDTTAIKDTATMPISTRPPSSPVAVEKETRNAGDTATYKMIFEVTRSRQRASSRTAQLNSLHSYTRYDSIPVNDSVSYYRLYLPMKVRISDTSHVKDSLRIFFGKRIYIVKP